MFSIAFAVSALASAAFVQAGNPLIPDGISSGCSTFMNQLDQDSTITSCTSSLITATSAFAPGSPAASASDITTALASVCTGPTPGCDASYVRTQLSAFYAACTNEITGATPVKGCVDAYDLLYVLVPLTEAICSQDDSGASCVTETTGPVSATKRELVERKAAAEAQVPVLAVNTSTYRAENLAFLYLSPSTPKSSLCVTCTRKILSSYISFETSIPYAASLANSPILGGQQDLYNAVSSQCGADFVTGSVQAVGSLSGGLGGSTSAALAGREVNGALAAAAALFVGVWAL